MKLGECPTCGRRVPVTGYRITMRHFTPEGTQCAGLGRDAVPGTIATTVKREQA